MKVFAIRNDEDCTQKDLGYLVYYAHDKRFYVELPDDADEWETPLILSSFLKRDQKTVPAYWSRRWVQQRIVPTDRQNLGQILRENGLDEYDEFALLLLANGRCAQDSYYIAEVPETVLQTKFPKRCAKKVEEVIPLRQNKLLVFFRNGAVKSCDVPALVKDSRFFLPVLASESIFQRVSIQAGGYGVCWSEAAEIADSLLYEAGESLPLSIDAFISFVSNRVVSSAEAAELIGCSRQNIGELAKHGKLHPVRSMQKSTLFLKSEILQRQWKN